jgi:hypothetical protein
MARPTEVQRSDSTTVPSKNLNATKNGRAAPDQPCGLWLQGPFFEFFRRGTEGAELVNGRACGREGERLERFFCRPLGMLRCLRLHQVGHEVERHRLFAPERAVVVVCGDRKSSELVVGFPIYRLTRVQLVL